jgi:aminopeptidase N
VFSLYPEWKVNTEFINDHLERALKLDAKLSSHPIEVPCPDANKANQIFDSLSYSKAGSGMFSSLPSALQLITGAVQFCACCQTT